MKKIKPKPNHKKYLEILQRMTPEQHLNKAFELSEFARRLFIHGLRRRNPLLSEREFHLLTIRKLSQCHNRNY